MGLRLLNVRNTRAYIASSTRLFAITPPLQFASFTRLTRLSSSLPLPPFPPHALAPIQLSPLRHHLSAPTRLTLHKILFIPFIKCGARALFHLPHCSKDAETLCFFCANRRPSRTISARYRATFEIELSPP